MIGDPIGPDETDAELKAGIADDQRRSARGWLYIKVGAALLLGAIGLLVRGCNLQF